MPLSGVLKPHNWNLAPSALASSPRCLGPFERYTDPAIGTLVTDQGTGSETLAFCVGGEAGSLFVVSFEDGLLSGFPAPTGSDPIVGCSFGDVDVDAEVVASSESGSVHAWHADGSAVGGDWPVEGGSEIYGAPVVAEMDGDGVSELMVAYSEGEVVLYELPEPSTWLALPAGLAASCLLGRRRGSN